MGHPTCTTNAPRKKRRPFLTALGKVCLPLMTFLWGDLSVKWVRRWAKCLCLLAWPFTHATRKIVNANLEIAFPELNDRQRKLLCKKNLQYIFELGLDLLHFYAHPGDINSRLEVSPEVLQLKQKRQESTVPAPELYCTLHLGNWELASHMSFLTGQKGAVITARFDFEWLNELATRMRTSDTDTELIPAEGAARGMLRALKDGRDLGILIDQHVAPKKGGVFLKFFNLAVAASPLPATIALRRNLPVTLIACYKTADGHFAFDLEHLPKPTNQYADATELTQGIFTGYENLVRRHPEQFLWQYRYWRKCPANAPDEYAKRYPFYARRYKVARGDDSLWKKTPETH